jgi:hypothetical protein
MVELFPPLYVVCHFIFAYLIYDIFNYNWVDTHWQQYSSHLQTNNTQNTENGTYITVTKLNIILHNNKILLHYKLSGIFIFSCPALPSVCNIFIVFLTFFPPVGDSVTKHHLCVLFFADVEVISKFAHLENRLGEPERAQTLMEHILTSYPKRVDVWSIYVDMLVKNGQLESAR